ncbi:MAG TPA: universal stress protein [Gaiellaceae bacterium]
MEGTRQDPQPIVVGIDGSDASRAALRWAAAEARLRGVPVRAVHAWWAIPWLSDDAAPPSRGSAAGDWEATHDAEARTLIEAFIDATLGEATGRDVEVAAVSMQGVAAAAALLDASKDADLLVLGSRGRGGFAGLLLGSVSQQCVHHAHCPVVIVR